LACLLGNSICGRTSELMGGHDNPHIVWDEWAGMWLTLLPLSYMGIADGNFWQNIAQIPTIVAIIIAFILFRFFDIIKPPPIGWADKKVAGGLGIMLDDIIAGIMAAAVWVIIYTTILQLTN
ncbi:MAG: phosphatidylglycerophosphatase A, partial [Psychrobacter sp.]|nr:phosphatidylglycerophosphatase A [Psychrobacter sp.]